MKLEFRYFVLNKLKMSNDDSDSKKIIGKNAQTGMDCLDPNDTGRGLAKSLTLMDGVLMIVGCIITTFRIRQVCFHLTYPTS
jgi:hypothetical protein